MASFDPGKTAVLIMDFQNEIVANFAGDDDGLTKRAASVLEKARSAGIPVIHVVVEFRPGYPEVGARGTFTALRDAGRLQAGSQGAAIHPDVAPKDGDVVVVKRRVGAFSGSDLDTILRAQGREHLILLGIATSGVVLTTVRWAADLDYTMTVVSDGCADRDPEVHRVLLEKVFARPCNVVTSREVVASL